MKLNSNFMTIVMLSTWKRHKNQRAKFYFFLQPQDCLHVTCHIIAHIADVTCLLCEVTSVWDAFAQQVSVLFSLQKICADSTHCGASSKNFHTWKVFLRKLFSRKILSFDIRRKIRVANKRQMVFSFEK